MFTSRYDSSWKERFVHRLQFLKGKRNPACRSLSLTSPKLDVQEDVVIKLINQWNSKRASLASGTSFTKLLAVYGLF